MQGIIIIGDNRLTFDLIKQHNHKGVVYSENIDESRYFVELNNGHLYYDFCPEIINDFDTDELKHLPYSNLNFISILYSSIEVLKKVLIEDFPDKEFWVDDDFSDKVIPLRDFIKKIKEKPEWDWRIFP